MCHYIYLCYIEILLLFFILDKQYSLINANQTTGSEAAGVY